MGQKFFISFNSGDKEKAHWIAWTLREAGHEVAVHDWEVPAGGNAPVWMSQKLAWADRLVSVVSPDYQPAIYSTMEWASKIWDDPQGTKGAVIPVIVRKTKDLPALLRGLSRIDLTGVDEDKARRRLLKGIEMPRPPLSKPEFEAIAPEIDEQGPYSRPAFRGAGVRRSLFWMIVGVCFAFVTAVSFEAYRRDYLEVPLEVGWIKVDHRGMDRLIEDGGSGLPTENSDGEKSQLGAIVHSDADLVRDSRGQLGGWPSWLEVYQSAHRDPVSLRDQHYWFAELKNLGKSPIHNIHVQFSEESDSYFIRKLQKQRSRWIPVKMSGRHANLTRTQKREIQEIRADLGNYWWGGSRGTTIVDVPREEVAWSNSDVPGIVYGYPEMDELLTGRKEAEE